MDDTLPPEQDDDPSVDDAGNLPDRPRKRRRHTRPEKREPLVELARLREEKFPGMQKGDFAEKYLGITRLHMYYIESGRRPPSLELALRWIDALAPNARIDMFGPMPVVDERIRAVKRLREIAPEVYEAA